MIEVLLKIHQIKKHTICMAIVLMFLCVSLNAQSEWVWRNPLPQGNLLLDLVFTNGMYVVVGLNGSIMTSTDLDSWTVQRSGTLKDLRGLDFGNDRFIAVGNDGIVLTSSDAVTWKPVTSGSNNHLYSVIFANNLYIITGDSGTILTSSDGSNWSKRTSGTSTALSSITYANGRFVIVGLDGQIHTSSDGIEWTAATGAKSGDYLLSVTFADSQFVASGSDRYAYFLTCTSSDGITWKRHLGAIYVYLYSITYADNHYVAVGSSGYIGTSPDGVSWTRQTLINGVIFTKDFAMVKYLQNRFVVVGDSGAVVTSAYDSAAGCKRLESARLFGKSLQLHVFNKWLNIVLPDNMHCDNLAIDIYDLGGKNVYSAKRLAHSAMVTVPITYITPGIHTVSLTSNDQHWIGHFVAVK